MSQKYSYKDPFDVVVVFVLERPTKLRSYWDIRQTGAILM